MNDRNVSRVKTLNGYSSGGYGKSFKDSRGGYKAHGGPGAALIAANQPKKKTVRPVQLSSLKSESTSESSFNSTQLGSGGWNTKKEAPKQEVTRPTNTGPFLLDFEPFFTLKV